MTNINHGAGKKPGRRAAGRTKFVVGIAAAAFVALSPFMMASMNAAFQILPPKDGSLTLAGPSQLEGRWTIQQLTDPIDDTKTVKISLTAASVDGQLARPVFVARCQGGMTDVYIAWDTYIGSDPDFPDSPYRDVTVRLDEFPADVATTILSTDKTSTAFGSSEVFLQKLYDRQTLSVRVTPYRSGPVTAQFDLTGFALAMAPLRQACGWDGLTFIEGRVSVTPGAQPYGMITHIGLGRETTPFSFSIPGAHILMSTCATPGQERICYIKGKVVDRQLVEVVSVKAI